MGRKRKDVEHEDYDEDMVLKDHMLENIILKPVNKYGLAKVDLNFVLFKLYRNKYYFVGYYGEIHTALRGLYIHMLNEEVIVKAKKKDNGLTLTELSKIIESIQKDLAKLMGPLQKDLSKLLDPPKPKKRSTRKKKDDT